jgi:hypothetical protein
MIKALPKFPLAKEENILREEGSNHFIGCKHQIIHSKTCKG